MDQQIVAELEAEHAKAKQFNKDKNLAEYSKMFAPDYVMEHSDGTSMDRDTALAAVGQQFAATKSFHCDHHRTALVVLDSNLVKETVVQSIELGVPFLFFFTQKRQFQTIEETTWRRAGGGWQMVKSTIITDSSAETGNASVIHIPADDPAMKQAGVMARKTFRYFWREMSWEQRRIVPGVDLALVKVACSDPPEIQAQNPDALEVEYMWIGEVDFDGRYITGTLLNEPDTLTTFHEGQPMKLPAKQIHDWMYVQMGEVYGGFTIELMRMRMGQKELKQHDKAYGLEFGEPGVVQMVPEQFLGEGAYRGVYSSSIEGLPVRVAGDQSLIAKTEHPMSVNMRDSLIEALQQDPSMATEPDENGFTMLHGLALAGSYDGIDACMNLGVDPNLKTSNGMTPYMLAKTFAWKRVMQRLQQGGANG